MMMDADEEDEVDDDDLHDGCGEGDNNDGSDDGQDFDDNDGDESPSRAQRNVKQGQNTNGRVRETSKTRAQQLVP